MAQCWGVLVERTLLCCRPGGVWQEQKKHEHAWHERCEGGLIPRAARTNGHIASSDGAPETDSLLAGYRQLQGRITFTRRGG